MNHRQKKLKNYYSSRILALLCCGVFAAGAQSVAVEDIPPPPAANTNTQDQSEAKTPPPLPPADVESDDSRILPQPEVNIIHSKEGTVEEYRVNGKLRYAKVIPKKGKPYYLVDRDGDGILETRHNDLKGPPPVNQWILKEW